MLKLCLLPEEQVDGQDEQKMRLCFGPGKYVWWLLHCRVEHVCWKWCQILTNWELVLDMQQKDCRISFIVVASWMFALPHIRRSSTKRSEWMGGGQFCPNTMPCKDLFDMASCRARESSLMARTNRYGERGHPCLIPLSLRNLANGWPFTTTKKIGEEIHAWTKFMKWPCSPLRESAATMKFHSSRSKAFARSILSIKAWSSHELRAKEWVISWAMMMLLLMRRPAIKACWEGWM